MEDDELVPVAKLTVKKEKKPKREYNKPGQKYDTPEQLDVLRLFYHSLYQEEKKDKKTSESLTMAEKWCLERGIFDKKTQDELHNRMINANASSKKK